MIMVAAVPSWPYAGSNNPKATTASHWLQFISMSNYINHSRLGVVKVLNTTTVKDFYIVPLPANTALPAVLLPLDGPGLGEVKTHLLIAIVIRQRKKRHAQPIPSDAVPAKVSYTV